jgi:hypothetical protein
MRNHSLSGNIVSLLRRCKALEAAMRKAGFPAFLACLPVALLALQYVLMLREKTASIRRICGRMHSWLATVGELSAHERGRSEFIDLDRKMRGDIEGACDSMRSLRGLCVEICAMFSAVGHESGLLQRGRDRFEEAVKEACRLSQSLLDAVDAHDCRALAIRQQEHAIEQAGESSAAAHAARASAALEA